MRAHGTATLAAVAVVVTAALAAGELIHWLASRRGLGAAPHHGGTDAVVVLGYRNPGERANRINRYRVRAGIRSIDPAAPDHLLVLCGGAVAGDIPEAELMARYARDELGFTGVIALDRTSVSTWGNIRNAIPLIEHAASIAIVSNSLHAERGRAYLRALRPDLAARLRRGDDHRFGELTITKPVAVLRSVAPRVASPLITTARRLRRSTASGTAARRRPRR